MAALVAATAAHTRARRDLPSMTVSSSFAWAKSMDD
jgi:hypothetical protein